MAFSLDVVQDEIIAFLDANFHEPFVEQAIPDIETVKRNKQGKIDPYFSFQFGQVVQQGSEGFAGAFHADYQLPIYFQAVAPTPVIGRKMANKLTREFLGAGFSWAGEVRQRSGGPMFPMVQSTGAAEAYVFPSSFGLLMQLSLQA